MKISQTFIPSLGIILALLMETGCTTLETDVDSANSYDIVPIEVREKFFFFKPRIISVMNCALVQKKNIDRAGGFTISGIGPYSREKGGVYEFQKDSESDYRVEILGRSVGTKIGSLETFTHYRYLRFQKDGGVSYETSVQALPMETQKAEFTIYNESIGKITFTNYRSKNKNAPDAEWEYDTGYVMSVNDAEYGIIACLGKPAAYLKKGWQAIPHTDILMMYLLSVYENYELMRQW